jgi:hypothetical protein
MYMNSEDYIKLYGILLSKERFLSPVVHKYYIYIIEIKSQVFILKVVLILFFDLEE